MCKKYSRIQRIAQEMQKKIAIILQSEIKDPRVSMTTVSGIKVSSDLAYAKVFVTFLDKNTSEQVRIGIRVLQDAVGFIRVLLGKNMCLRIVPELTFIYDHSLLEGIHMINLINQIIQNDRLRCSMNTSKRRR